MTYVITFASVLGMDINTKTKNPLRISCACDICKINAAKVGASFPLAAEVPARFVKMSKKAHHALITDAHNPGAIGAAMRARTGMVAVA